MNAAARVFAEAPRIVAVFGDITVCVSMTATDTVRLQTAAHAVREMVTVMRNVQTERAAAARRGQFAPMDTERTARALRVAAAYATDSIAVLVQPPMPRRPRAKRRKRSA